MTLPRLGRKRVSLEHRRNLRPLACAFWRRASRQIGISATTTAARVAMAATASQVISLKRMLIQVLAGYCYAICGADAGGKKFAAIHHPRRAPALHDVRVRD